jgi:hypothetical protein
MPAFLKWLAAPELPQALSALLLPAVLAGGNQALSGGRDSKRGGGGAQQGGGSGVDVCQSDAAIEGQCAEAFNTVTHFELTHPVDADGMAADYLQVGGAWGQESPWAWGMHGASGPIPRPQPCCCGCQGLVGTSCGLA